MLLRNSADSVTVVLADEYYVDNPVMDNGHVISANQSHPVTSAPRPQAHGYPRATTQQPAAQGGYISGLPTATTATVPWIRSPSGPSVCSHAFCPTPRGTSVPTGRQQRLQWVESPARAFLWGTSAAVLRVGTSASKTASQVVSIT